MASNVHDIWYDSAVNDKSDRINALKIDRAAATPQGGTRWWLLVPAVAVVIAVGWWFLLRPGAGAVLVETDTARRPPSVAAASSVLDASGYVVARRQATEIRTVAPCKRAPDCLDFSCLRVRDTTQFAGAESRVSSWDG